MCPPRDCEYSKQEVGFFSLQVQEIVVPASALAECYLRKLSADRFVHYSPGSEDFFTREDEEESGELFGSEPLRTLDPQNKARLEKIKDLVVFRYGGTGVQEAINKAVECRQMIPVYWVRNVNTFQCDRTEWVFRDSALVKEGAPVREVFNMVFPEQQNCLAFIEDAMNCRVGENEPVTRTNNIFKFSIAVSQNRVGGSSNA